MDRFAILQKRLRLWTWLFLVGLVLSGLTAIPIQAQFDLGARWLGADFSGGGFVPEFISQWLSLAYAGVSKTTAQAPFVWYGTDWLAFGQVAIGLAVVRALRDPVRNALRPEIFARINEKLVFHRLGYDHQLEIAEKFLTREIAFLAAKGHELELHPSTLPFLVRKGFHPKLGARPMRDTVEKLVGDAVAERLLVGQSARGLLSVDEARDCLAVR